MSNPAPRVSTKVVLLVSLWLSTGAWAQSAPAEPAPASPAPPDSGVPSEPKPKPPPSPGVTITAAPGKGFTVASEDGKYSATIRGRFQMRETVTGQGVEGADRRWTQEQQIRTVRLFLQGHVLNPDLKYTLQLAFGGNDFEAGSSSPLFDVWVEYTALRDLNLRVGQFFVPFDRARTIRESGLQFVDRPLIIGELTLDRDMGLMLSSNDFLGKDGVLSYNLGFFGGEGRNRFGASTPGLLYVARFAVRPFGAFDDDVEGDLQRLPKPRLMVGVAGAYNQKTNRQRSTTGTTFVIGTFDYAHAAVDTVFKYNGLSVLAEALYRDGSPNFRDGTVNGQPAREWSRSGWGYLVQAGYMLTSKLEATGRFDLQKVRSDSDPALIAQVETAGREVGVGLNAYLNGHAFKIQGDYAYQFGRTGPTRHLVRLQLDASF
ncbi:porin [Pyxidicoccus fallax]|uniref:Porin n=1 Tax=Pyxidicoccus fallax TaxID=394095 RepID=A0A848LE00_9BACT|nr:porin [Pyxidicoccus fallax]NMO13668.1 porin [Pyxidicoccus fallax]NPC76844.1 porin [Pyxidicoccus fallax]